MPARANASLDALIDRVKKLAESPENAARRAVTPRIVFQLEEPIASTLMDGMSVERYYADPAYYAEQSLLRKLWRWDTFPDDRTPIDATLPASLGFYPEYTFAGLTVHYNERGVPDIQTDHQLTTDPDLRHLSPVDFLHSGWMPRALAWHDALRDLIRDRLPVPYAVTWWRGCLDIAIQFRGYEGFIADTMERPEFAHALLSFLTEQRCRWWEGYYLHFGEKRSPSFVGDDWINVPFISPHLFRDFVLPEYKKIEEFHGGIGGIHSCGNQTLVQKYMLELKSLPTFEVSPWTDLEGTLRNVPPDKDLVVSLHPNDVLCASPAEMEQKLTGVVAACRGRRFLIATSGLTPLSPAIPDFVSRVRTWTTIARAIQERSS